MHVIFHNYFEVKNYLKLWLLYNHYINIRVDSFSIMSVVLRTELTCMDVHTYACVYTKDWN